MKNRLIAKIITSFPSLGQRLIDSYHPWESEDIPWTPVVKPLADSKVAMVTTAGVHHRDQEPFDMKDPDGDPTYRVIDSTRPVDTLMITHDYYDHSDADRDINIVLPVDRIGEMAEEGRIGAVADRHYSFMGHIDGRHISTLIEETGREVAHFLKEEGVDVALLTPG